MDQKRPNPYLLRGSEGPEEITNHLILANSGLDGYFFRELSDIASVAKSLQEKPLDFSVRLQKAIPIAGQSLLGSLGVRVLERLAEELPAQRQIVSEQIAMLEDQQMMSALELQQSKRIRVLDREIFFASLNLSDHKNYSQDTFDFIAHGFLKTLEKLSVVADASGNPLFTAEEIADSLNRHVVFNHKFIPDSNRQAPRSLSSSMRLLAKKILSYPGLSPYVFIYLQAALAVKADGTSTATFARSASTFSRACDFDHHGI